MPTLSSSHALDNSSACVFAQDVVHVLMLDDVRRILQTLHVDGVNSHGENHRTLVDDTLDTHDVRHAESQSMSLDTGSLAVDIAFEVIDGKGMLTGNDGVAFFGLFDVVAEVDTEGHTVENGAREDGVALAEFVAVAACGFVSDGQASGLVRVFQDHLSIVLHAKVDDQALEERCGVAKRVQPIHDLVLDLELGFHGLVVLGNRRFFSEDAECVDSEVYGQDALAQISVDAGKGRSCGGLEHDDLLVGSSNGLFDEHVQHLARQTEQREHSSRNMFCRKIFSRAAGHGGSRIGRLLALALAHDVVDDPFANFGALLGLEACRMHD
jgi:hypothetical protein